MKAPERLETERLLLRRPRMEDAEAIFTRYSGDREVTHFLGWPRHESSAETRQFLEFSEAQWEEWPAGPYLIEFRDEGTLLGSTGFAFETPYRATTGYVLAKDAWGKGHATEALRALVDLTPQLGLRRLYAYCHSEHPASAHVLEKCGFVREGLLRCHTLFPNLGTGEPSDVLSYALIIPA